MKIILKDQFLILLIILGLTVRFLVISLPGFKFDIEAWFAWAIRLNQVGFNNFYSDQIWTNYTPGYLYILKVLGMFKIIFNIPDNIFILVLKLPSILSEIILGIFIYDLVNKKSIIWARISSALVLLNPVFIFNSAVWGQIDGLLSLCLFLSIYMLFQKRLILSSALLGLSFLVKPQTIALLPVFLLFLNKDFSIKNSIKFIIPVILIIFALSLPFYTNNLLGFPKLFSQMTKDYSYTSLFAYNLWGAVGFWISDEKVWNNLPYAYWGYILYFSYLLLLSFLFLKKKLSIFSLATLSLLGFYFLPTRIHDRYLYPAIIFLIVLTGMGKLKSLLYAVIFLSIMHFFNLYYVYVYYNEIYAKSKFILYNPYLYNFLNQNGQFLSITSTAIFIITTVILIRHGINLKKT